MRVCVLASGSKGNVTFIETKSHRILIDLGTSCLATEKKLKEIGIEPNTIDSIFITHSHADHVSGLRVFIKKYKPVIYLTPKIYNDIREFVKEGESIFIERELEMDDFSVETFKTSHDTEESLGYIITSDNKSLVYITDTGYINERILKKITNKEIYVMESNHDTEMLMNGSYPFYIKQRIIGDSGHLSNVDAAYYLSKVIGENTEKVFLAHLSHDNNTEELAKTTLEDTLKKRNISFDNITIARQDSISEVIEV